MTCICFSIYDAFRHFDQYIDNLISNLTCSLKGKKHFTDNWYESYNFIQIRTSSDIAKQIIIMSWQFYTNLVDLKIMGGIS